MESGVCHQAASAVSIPRFLFGRLESARVPCDTGKTRRELVELEASINEQLESGAVPDPEYWTAVLSRLSIWQVCPPGFHLTSRLLPSRCLGFALSRQIRSYKIF